VTQLKSAKPFQEYWNKRARAYLEQLTHAKEQRKNAHPDDLPELNAEIQKIQDTYLMCVEGLEKF